MHIPTHWVKETGTAKSPGRREMEVAAWGWSDRDDADARSRARERLARLVEMLRREERPPRGYAYGKRPLREEVVEVLDADSPVDASAVITRNAYGALVLNTADLLFLDVDDRDSGKDSGLLGKLFGRRKPEEPDLVPDPLRQALADHRPATTFRVYRTAAGYRALAVDRAFDPTGDEAHELMAATGTDSAYAHLCRVQESFRARLTPKPWRCDLRPPEERFPFESPEERQRFDAWLARYDGARAGYATCRYLETIGGGGVRPEARQTVDLHDDQTGALFPGLPLA